VKHQKLSWLFAGTLPLFFIITSVNSGYCADNKPETLSEKSCEEHLREANDRCDRGKCGDAIPFYDALLGKGSSCPEGLKGEALYGRGRAKEATQDFVGAVSDFNTVFQMYPDVPKFKDALGKGYYHLANQKERFGDYKGAMVNYFKVLQLIPDFREASEGIAGRHYESGLGKQKRGELTEAREEFEKALRYRPNYPEARKAKKALEEKLRNKSAEREGMFGF
jgi:tetratricopeptide (TPR) repeat protein